MDGPVEPAQAAELLDVGFADRGWRRSQLGGVVQQGSGGGVEVRLPVVGLNGFDQFMVLDLGPEVVAVGQQSVVTVVHARDDDGDHLALGPGER